MFLKKKKKKGYDVNLSKKESYYEVNKPYHNGQTSGG